MLGHEQFGSQGFQASRLVGPTTAMLKKAEHQTVSSKAKLSTPFGTFLVVKMVQARDKLAYRSYQAPSMGIFYGFGYFGGVQEKSWRRGRCTVGAR